MNDTGFRKALLRMTAVLLGSICGLAQAESLFEDSNLASFNVIPDVVAEGVKPYDEQLWKTGIRIDGKVCCVFVKKMLQDNSTWEMPDWLE